jgi:phosphoglucosamine mutase
MAETVSGPILRVCMARPFFALHHRLENPPMSSKQTRRYFGTDGIRGLTNSPPMTAAIALKLGQAAGRHFLRGSHTHRVVIGKDTRLSGYMMESALVAGFTSVGMDVTLLGPMPTPAVAMLTRSMRADIGVMISASHNPFHDNGIKLFGPDGYKLSDDDEMAIEALLEEEIPLAEPRAIGRARRIDDAQGRYIHFAKATFPEHLRLDGLKIVIDCAHGAAYKVAPAALWELGAEVIAIGVAPDGFNVNDKVGSTHPKALQLKVLESGADIGIALDGDADRLIVVDERGQVVDGDQLMALIASRAAEAGTLKGGALVATVMSNLGLERFLESKGIALHRANVGDRHVLELMRDRGCNVGGEQSGHIILSDHATTGDGLVAALQVLAALVGSGKPASELLHLFDPLPQMLKNVRFKGGAPLEAQSVKDAIAAGEAKLAGQGRLLIRKSGTEPLIRVMAEGEDKALVGRVVDDICAAVAAAAA